VPPVMLVCADSGEVAASRSATAEVDMNVFIFQILSMATMSRSCSR
jgi:hypothetical protein